MMKFLVFLFALSLVSCQVGFDPAGSLAARQRSTPTGTSTAAPIMPATPGASATSIVSCKASGDLNIRNAPNAYAQILDYLFTGQVVTVTGESGDWRQIRTKAGTIGYVNGKWLNCR